MPNDTLLPCPFCGGKGRLAMSTEEKMSIFQESIGDFTSLIPNTPKGIRAWRIICTDCECWGPVTIVRNYANNLWNTRHKEMV